MHQLESFKGTVNVILYDPSDKQSNPGFMIPFMHYINMFKETHYSFSRNKYFNLLIALIEGFINLDG